MFEHMFQWTVRHGSRLLFAVAVLIFALGVLATIVRFANTAEQVAAGHAVYELPYGNVMLLLGGVLSALKEAAVPLAAAIVLDRFDRWLERRHTSGISD